MTEHNPFVDRFRARIRELGMIDAVAADVLESERAGSHSNSALDRAVADAMRDRGASEDDIIDKFGYSPEPSGAAVRQQGEKLTRSDG